MIRGAIFDMDGTLLHSMQVWDRLSQRYLQKFGVEVTAADYAALEGQTQYENAAYFCARYPEITETPGEVSAGMNRIIRQRYEELAVPRDGTRELLTALRDAGVPTAVATLTDRMHAEQALHDHGLLDFFDIVLTTQDAGVSKRAPRIYQMAAEHFNMPEKSCMVFEDAPYAGQTAKRAGFQLCGMREPFYAKGETELRRISDLFVEHSFSEIMPAILQKTQ